jgi:hypothetical protein
LVNLLFEVWSKNYTLQEWEELEAILQKPLILKYIGTIHPAPGSVQIFDVSGIRPFRHHAELR